MKYMRDPGVPPAAWQGPYEKENQHPNPTP